MGSNKSKTKSTAPQLATPTPKKDSNKILLLGTSQSGKTSLARDLKLIVGSGFQKEERVVFCELIPFLILAAMNQIVQSLNEEKQKFDLLPDPNTVFLI